MFSTSSVTAAPQKPSFRTILVPPYIPELTPLKPSDYGIPKDAQKQLNLDPEKYSNGLNRGWTETWSNKKEKIENTYKKQVVLKEMEELFSEIKKDMTSLGNPNITLWNQRIATITCASPQGAGEAPYLKVTCTPGIPITSYSLDIRSIPQNQSKGLNPISSPGLSSSLDWTEGILMINDIKIPIKAQMSLASVLLAINQAGRKILSASYIIIQNPTDERDGLFKLSFQSHSPETRLFFDDDQEGQILEKLGFQRDVASLEESIIVLDGTEIRRPSVVLSDVIPGMKLEILRRTPTSQENFLNIRVEIPEKEIEKTLEHFCEKLRELHQLILFHSPSDPKTEGLLKEFSFLKQMDQEILSIFRKGFGPQGPQGQQNTPDIFGVEIFQGGAVFNPINFKKAMGAPETCREFFMQSSFLDGENIGIISVPSNFEGCISLRLLTQEGQDFFFLKSPYDATEIRGRIQGKSLRGPQGHPLESLFLFYDDTGRDLMNSGQSLETTLTIVPGFSNTFLNFFDKYERNFTETNRGLKKIIDDNLSDILRVQKTIDQKRQDIQKKSSRFQQAYVKSKMQENFQKHLLEETFGSK
jgi:flagellar capping protein FliD